mgnify:FL=1|tara:strand:+ start:1042 stop:1344 length:303 start_codon:yes stop_codon:yes gene_type:complete
MTLMKKWKGGEQINLKWVRSIDWQMELARESDTSMPEFVITLVNCHFPDCQETMPKPNEHGYIMVARDDNKQAACGHHAKMDLRVCNNELCKVCDYEGDD